MKMYKKLDPRNLNLRNGKELSQTFPKIKKRHCLEIPKKPWCPDGTFPHFLSYNFFQIVLHQFSYILCSDTVQKIIKMLKADLALHQWLTKQQASLFLPWSPLAGSRNSNWCWAHLEFLFMSSLFIIRIVGTFEN